MQVFSAEPGANVEAPWIRVCHLRKTFVTRKSRIRRRPAVTVLALDDVSFEISPGHITGLLGPNGAGKTTLISIFCDLFRADGGTVTLAGLPLPAKAREVQRLIGLVTTNDRSFFWRLSGRENLEFFGALQGLPRAQLKSRAQELLAQFGLERDADRLFRTYSTGMKKRLAIARALLHDPQVLFMDEATSGLDAEASEGLLELVRTTMPALGKSVLWATHRLDEVRVLCDRVLVLAAGRLRFDGSLGDFLELRREPSGYLLELEGEVFEAELLSFLESLNAASERHSLCHSRGRTLLRVTTATTAAELDTVIRRLLELGAALRRVEPAPVSLKDLFAYLATEDARFPASDPMDGS